MRSEPWRATGQGVARARKHKDPCSKIQAPSTKIQGSAQIKGLVRVACSLYLWGTFTLKWDWCG